MSGANHLKTLALFVCLFLSVKGIGQTSPKFLQLTEDADKALNAGSFAKASDLGKQLIQENSNNYKGYYYAGLAFYKLGSKSLAKDYLQNAWQLADADNRPFIRQLIDAIDGELKKTEYLLHAKEAESRGDIGEAAELYFQAYKADNSDFNAAKKAVALAEQNRDATRAFLIYSMAKRSNSQDQFAWGTDGQKKYNVRTFLDKYHNARTLDQVREGLFIFPTDIFIASLAMSMTDGPSALQILEDYITNLKNEPTSSGQILWMISRAQRKNFQCLRLCFEEKDSLLDFLSRKKGSKIAADVGDYLTKARQGFDRILSARIFACPTDDPGASEITSDESLAFPLVFDPATMSFDKAINKKILQYNFKLKGKYWDLGIIKSYKRLAPPLGETSGPVDCYLDSLYDPSFAAGPFDNPTSAFDKINLSSITYTILRIHADVTFHLPKGAVVRRHALVTIFGGATREQGLIAMESGKTQDDRYAEAYLNYVLNNYGDVGGIYGLYMHMEGLLFFNDVISETYDDQEQYKYNMYEKTPERKFVDGIDLALLQDNQRRIFLKAQP